MGGVKTVENGKKRGKKGKKGGKKGEKRGKKGKKVQGVLSTAVGRWRPASIYWFKALFLPSALNIKVKKFNQALSQNDFR